MATRGQQEPSADRDLDLPAVAGQELPQGAEKKREAVSCLGMTGGGGGACGRGGDVEAQNFTSQGTAASISNKLSSGGSQGSSENSPSTGVKKAYWGGVS